VAPEHLHAEADVDSRLVIDDAPDVPHALPTEVGAFALRYLHGRQRRASGLGVVMFLRNHVVKTRKWPTIVIALAVAAVVIAPAKADAATPKYYVACQWHETWLVIKPHRCFFEPYENASHAEQAPIKNIHWRSWGGRHAVGRGMYFYNSGYHAPVRFRLYRPVRDYEGDFIYTRLRGVIGRGCTAPIDGKRWCDPVGRQHHFRMRV
jgi:hypothetical protein